MDLKLAGARALVTAASAGLGAATARQLSLEGAVVVINSRNLGRLQETASRINAESGNPVFTLASDVSDPEANERLIRHAADMLGGLDILVVNAGGPPGGSFEALSIDAWHAAFGLTVMSAVSLIRAALPYLRRSSRAAVLAIVSIAGKQPVPNLTLSNVLRPAVLGLTKTLSDELASAGIRVNSLLPGITETARVAHLIEQAQTPQAKLAFSPDQIPLGRLGKPEEFANAAAFLCSPAAGFITGVALTVDGGSTRSII
jgi:3-oxoacyl-[acyl-carrier protein] reductase